MKGFYINLDHRTDRRAEIEVELEGQDVERFSAIPHAMGFIGCTMSHIECLKLARDRGYPEVLIFEDDFMWTGEHVIPDLPADQDVCMLGYQAHHPDPTSGVWTRGRGIQAPSGYIVHSRFQNDLIDCMSEGLEKLVKTGEHWNYMNDQQWKKLQNDSLWQCSNPHLGKQRPSQSDLGKKFIDQGGV